VLAYRVPSGLSTVVSVAVVQAVRQGRGIVMLGAMGNGFCLYEVCGGSSDCHGHTEEKQRFDEIIFFLFLKPRTPGGVEGNRRRQSSRCADVRVCDWQYEAPDSLATLGASCALLLFGQVTPGGGSSALLILLGRLGVVVDKGAGCSLAKSGSTGHATNNTSTVL
jgi:hypothetical protein